MYLITTYLIIPILYLEVCWFAVQKHVYQQNICKDVASKFEKPWKYNKNVNYLPFFVHSFIDLYISEMMVSDKSVQDILRSLIQPMDSFKARILLESNLQIQGPWYTMWKQTVITDWKQTGITDWKQTRSTGWKQTRIIIVPFYCMRHNDSYRNSNNYWPQSKNNLKMHA